MAVFQLSGGTTGVPKVIPRRHAEYWYNAAEYARSWGWTSDTRVAHLIPIIHNAGVVCAVHAPHSAGACLVLGTADLDEALPFMAREKATHVLLGHGHFRAVAHPAFGAAAASLTQVVLSGAKVPPALFDDLEGRGLWSAQLFGMGEGLFLTTRPGAPRVVRATTVGTPLSPRRRGPGRGTGHRARCPTARWANSAARGPYTLRGYYARRSTTRARSPPTASTAPATWCGRRPERQPRRRGREKDLINRGGEKISAEEVENLLCSPTPPSPTRPSSPCPTRVLGERTCAYVVVDGEQLTLPEVQAHFAALGVAKFKWPERVEHLTEIPRTLVGKTDKKRLAADIAAKLGALPSRA